MSTVVSTKGQVTIPKEIRDRLGLHPGTRLEFTAQGGKLVAQKAAADQDPVGTVTGILPAMDVDEYLDETRGPA